MEDISIEGKEGGITPHEKDHSLRAAAGFAQRERAMAFAAYSFIVLVLCVSILADGAWLAHGSSSREDAASKLSTERGVLARKLLHISRGNDAAGNSNSNKKKKTKKKKKRSPSASSSSTDAQMNKRRVRRGSDPIHNRS